MTADNTPNPRNNDNDIEAPTRNDGDVIPHTRDVGEDTWEQFRDQLVALMPTKLASRMQQAAFDPAGERRTLAILAWRTDLIHQDGHAPGSETRYIICDRLIQTISEVIYDYEGLIHYYDGTRLTAIFGLPTARENDSNRAVRAAIRLQSKLRPVIEAIEREFHIQMVTHAGIHASTMIVSRDQEGNQSNWQIVGKGLLTTEALRDHSPTNAVLVSRPIYQQTAHTFEYAEAASSTVPDQDPTTDGPRGYILRGFRESPGRRRGLETTYVPMIGRQRALKLLLNTWERVDTEREVHVATICGEAGVGKTRLVSEFVAEVQRTRGHVYQGSCETYARRRPLHLISDLLHDILAISHADTIATKRDALDRTLGELTVPTEQWTPYLSSILGLPPLPNASATQIDHLDDATLQKLTHGVLQSFLRVITERQTTVLILEDLHWIDPASLEALQHLIHTISDRPILLVLVSRDSVQKCVMQPLINAAATLPQAPVSIHLEPLSQMDCEEFVKRLIPQTTDENRSVHSLVVERSEGNPFYVEELVRMLLERGALRKHEDAYIVMPDAETYVGQVPPTLAGLLLARLDSLPDNLRHTLQAASVFGTQVSPSLLGTVLALQAREAEGLLQNLTEHGFLVPTPSQKLEGDANWSFRHALVQETVYHTLLSRDQKRLHGFIAHEIEKAQDVTSPTIIETLSYHFRHSAEPEKAGPYLVRAAEIASRRCDYAGAIDTYRYALQDNVVSAISKPELLQAKIDLGCALKHVGQYSEAKQLLESALRTALYDSLRSDVLTALVSGLRELADIRHMEGSSNEAFEFLASGLQAVEEEGRDANLVLWRSIVERMSWIRFREGRLDEAFELASEATLDTDIERDDDPITLASLYNTLGGIAWQRGTPKQAAKYVALSLRLHSRLQYPWGMGNAYTNLGVLHYTLGEWQAASQELTRAEKLWHQIGDVHQRAVALNNLGILQQATGPAERAREALATSLELFTNIGEKWGQGRAHTSLARLALASGDRREAARHIQRADALFQDMGRVEVEVEWVKAAVMRTTNLTGARGTVQHALQLARERHQTEEEIECLRLLGEIKHREGQLVEAENLLRESMNLCQQTNMPYGLALALNSLGQLYIALSENGSANRQQHVDNAVEVLQRAVNQFNDLGAGADRARAQAALTALEARETRTGRPTLSAVGERSEVVESRSLPDGDTRPVSVVWISSVPRDEANEEAVFDALAELTVQVTATAERHKGTMLRQNQDIMLVFGAEHVLENDLERAITAAYRFSAQLAASRSLVTDTFEMGIGIDTGSAVTGHIGSQLHTEFVVQGEPVDEARRLATRVPAGEVWVTQKVRDGTERVAIYDSDEVLPGVWRLASLVQSPGSPRGIRGIRAPMIGRESMLRQMLQLSNGLQDGVGAVVWIEGEPGIGKSRLMEEYRSAMTAQGLKVWRAQCTPHSGSHVFSLFSDLLIQVFGLRHTDSPEVIRDQLVSAFKQWPTAIQSTRPYLEVILGMWPTGLPGERLAKLEPEQLRQQIFVSVRRFLKLLARQNPIVMLLDDLHWIDPISSELLSFLMTIVANEPIILVCAQRRQGGEAPNDRLIRAQSLIPDLTLRLTLKRLSNPDRRRLLDELLPGTDVPQDVTRMILERSDGNPYFVEEHLKMMLDQGYLIQKDGQWVVRDDLRADEVSVPSSLEALLRSRVDSLPPDLRDVMQTAAVIGSPFETDVLAAVLEVPTLTDALTRLNSRLLVQPGRDPCRWEFHHPMIADVIYNSLLEARRRHLHQAVAEVLAQRQSDEENVEAMAFHLVRAGRGSQALAYLVSAGERAASRCANEVAIDHLEAAAEALSKSPDASDKLRWRLAAALGDVYRAMGRHQDSLAALRTGLALTQTGMLDTTRRAGLYRRLGETARKQGDYEEALKHYEIGRRILRAAESREEHTELARIHLGRAWVHFHQGALDTALDVVQVCREVAEKADAIAELSAVENLLGGIYYRLSQWHAAERHTQRALMLREQMGYMWGVAGTLSNLGVLTVRAGDWHKARSCFERSLKLRDDMDDAEGLALLLNNLGNLSRDQGDLAEAESFFQRSLDTLQRFRHNYHFANATAGLASVYCAQGRLDLARETLAPALKLVQEINARDLLVDTYRWRVEILRCEGNYQQARATADRALALAKETQNQTAMATLWRLSSEAELAQDHLDQAAELLEFAQELITSVTDVLERGRLHLLAARISLAQGDMSNARPDLRAAQRIFLQLEAKLDLRRVQELIRGQATA